MSDARIAVPMEPACTCPSRHVEAFGEHQPSCPVYRRRTKINGLVSYEDLTRMYQEACDELRAWRESRALKVENDKLRAALVDVQQHAQISSCECVDIPRPDCCTCGSYEYSEALAHVDRVLEEVRP